MTSPNPDDQPEFRPKPRFLSSSRTSMTLGVVFLAGIAGGVWKLWTFVQTDLGPLVQKNLIQTFNRPVQLGRVERFSLIGLRFGPTSVPATPADPDHVSIKAVDVSFNPLQLLFTRTLHLDVTLVQPEVYFEQDKQGRWVRTTLATQQKPGLIKTQLDTVRLQNAEVVLVASPKPGNRRVPFVLAQVNGSAQLPASNQQAASYELGGQPSSGGSLEIKGETSLKTSQTNLQIQAQNLLGADLTRLVKLPLEVRAGRIDANVTAQLSPNPQQQPALLGTASLKAVTAKFDRIPQSFINTQGTLRFQRTQIGLDNVSSSFGKVPLLANGVLDTLGEFNLTARVPTVSLANTLDTLKVKLPLKATGFFGADLRVTGPIAKPILSGTFANIKPVRIDRVDFSDIRSQFAFATATSVISLKNLQVIPVSGGKIAGAGTIGLGPKTKTEFNVAARNISGDAIARLYNASPQIHIGTVTVNTQTVGTLTNLETVVSWQAPQATYPTQGRSQIIIAGKNTLLLRNTAISIAGGTVQADGQLSNGSWQATATANNLHLEQLSNRIALQTPLSGTLNLSSNSLSFKPETISLQGSGHLDIAGGTVTAANIQASGGRWRVLGNLAGINPGEIAQVPPGLKTPLSGTFNLTGSTASFQPQNLTLQGEASINALGGTVTASNINIARGQWQTSGTASGLQLGRLLPQVPSQFQGTLRDGKFNLSGSVAAISPRTIQGSASGSLQVAGSTVTANNIQLSKGRWQGNFTANSVELGQLARLALLSRGKNLSTLDVGGRLSGNINASGSLLALNPAAISASGQLRVLNLAAGGLKLDPVLSGNVNLVPQQGASLQLEGAKDRISLLLSPTYRPVSFLFQLGSAVATGRTQGDTLLVQSNNFPISIFKAVAPLPAVIASQPVFGTLDADLAINLNTYAVAGNLAVANPTLGAFRGNQFTAQFRYGNGVGTLTNGLLTQGTARYTLAGSITQAPDGPRFQAQVKIAQAQVQTLLAALQLNDIQDLRRGLKPPVYGSASTVRTASVGLPNAPLQTQLRRFSEINELHQQYLARQQASPLPPLADFKGTIDGAISLSGALKSGIAAQFDLAGNNWQWGKYVFDPVIARGRFANGTLALLPLRIQSNQTLVAFAGEVGGTQQSGQLQIRNFPTGVLKDFVKLPVAITGDLNATATLAGSKQNPQVVGALNLVGGTLNQKPINSAQANFSYSNARLNFGSKAVIASINEPIQASGSIPYALPFAAVKPNSDQISLDVNVQNQGLALLNLLTDQVAWEGGEGQLQVRARGTLKRPVVTGTATVNDATIAAQALPEGPLTGVTGTARLNGDRVRVEGIRGNFSKGQVVAQGVLPIFANLRPNDPDSANPLTVNLNQLRLNLKERYQGGVDGNVVIKGSALNPVIGGDVQLSQGRVLLTQAVTNAAAAALSGTGTNSSGAATKELAPAEDAAGGGIVPAFNNLQVTLGKGIVVTLPPVLNFQTTGSLILNGTLNEPRPQGVVQLRGGSLNLFTTQFTLARRYEQTVTFRPKQAFDPILDLRLVAVVPEVTQSPNQNGNSLFNFSNQDQNISSQVTDFGALQTVRVQAQITGPASKIIDNLQLTSEPSRSRSQIYALLGGGSVQAIGSGNAALGVANLASSTLLGNFQQPITKLGNAIGLSELRIFPTILNSYSSASTRSSIGLVAEGDIDISGNLSGSILRVLTESNIPTQFGLSYQLTDHLRLRTLTDFSGDSRTTVEYQNQF